MVKLYSNDIWCHIKLFMVQGKYNIDALMDLKIERNMVLLDLKNLLQKLAAPPWTRSSSLRPNNRSASGRSLRYEWRRSTRST